MNWILITALLVFALTLVGAAVRRLRQFRLKERYALIFLGFSVPFLVLAVNPNLITAVAEYLGMDYRTLQLLGVTAFLVFVVIELLTIVSVQERRIIQLAQHVAALEQKQQQASQSDRRRAGPRDEEPERERPAAFDGAPAPRLVGDNGTAWAKAEKQTEAH